MKFLSILFLVLAHTNILRGSAFLDLLFDEVSRRDGRNSSPAPILVKDNSTFTSVIDDEFIEIPDSIFKDIASARDLQSLQGILGIKEERPLVPSFIPRTSTTDDDSLLRSKSTDIYLQNPEQAHCEPELRTVNLGLRSTNAVTYYPTCIRIMQCGGCCQNSDIMACQPTASEKAFVKVLKLIPQSSRNEVSGRLTRTRGRRRRDNVRVKYNSVNVTVEVHTECRCMCKVRESDCDLSVHEYFENSCSCQCTNRDEENKCRQKGTHVWNKSNCQCLCRKLLDCSSSEQFDHNTCSCIPQPISVSWDDLYLRRRQPSSSRRSLNTGRKPVPVPIDII